MEHSLAVVVNVAAAYWAGRGKMAARGKGTGTDQPASQPLQPRSAPGCGCCDDNDVLRRDVTTVRGRTPPQQSARPQQHYHIGLMPQATTGEAPV